MPARLLKLFDRRTNTLINVFVLLALAWLHLQLSPYAFDDAFIHFRIARNLLDAGTPYFNLGEPLKVSTSSAWTVVVAAVLGAARLARGEAHFLVLMSLGNALFTWTGMLVYTRILQRLLGRRLSFAQLLLFQIPYLALLLPASIGLMETPFALLVAGWGIDLLLRAKAYGLTLLGVAAYIRIELLALLGLVCFLLLLKKRIKPPAVLGYAFLGLLPFLLYDLAYFGTIIPHSIRAKAVVYSIPRVQTTLQIGLYSLPILPQNKIGFYLVVGVIFLGLVFLPAFMLWRERRNFSVLWPLVFLLWSAAVIGAYIFGRALLFEWYIPLYMIPLLCTCFAVAYLTPPPRNLALIDLLVVLALGSIFSLASAFYAGAVNPAAYRLFESNTRVGVYKSIGARLYQAYPDARLLTSEIGGLGYTFHGPILDAAGLASSAALQFHPMAIPEQRAHGGMGAIPPQFVAATRPELIVSYDNFAQALLADAIVSEYTLVELPALLPEDAHLAPGGEVFGNNTIRVYIRKDLPLAAWEQ